MFCICLHCGRRIDCDPDEMCELCRYDREYGRLADDADYMKLVNMIKDIMDD